MWLVIIVIMNRFKQTIMVKMMILMKWILLIFKKKEYKRMMKIMIRLKLKEITTEEIVTQNTFQKISEFKSLNLLDSLKTIQL